MPTQRKRKEQTHSNATDHNNPYAAYDQGVANATRFFTEVVFKNAPEDGPPATRSTTTDNKELLHAT